MTRSDPPVQHVIAPRLLLTALLLFGMTVLLWTNPTDRAPLDWLASVGGGYALSALLLDFAARCRVHNAFGLLALAGLFGLGASLLLLPGIALFEMPASVFSRALGAFTLAGLLMLLLYRDLLHGPHTLLRRARLLLVSGVIGLGWGTWARWHLLGPANTGETALPVMLAAGGIGASLIVLALLWVARTNAPPAARLSRGGWVGVTVVLVGLLGWRLATGAVGAISLAVLLLLMIYCWLILWFQQRKRAVPLFDFVPQPGLVTPLLAAAGLLGGGVIGYGLPRTFSETDAVVLIGALFTTFGFVWLPTVSLVLGARAFLRQVRAQRL